MGFILELREHRLHENLRFALFSPYTEGFFKFQIKLKEKEREDESQKESS